MRIKNQEEMRNLLPAEEHKKIVTESSMAPTTFSEHLSVARWYSCTETQKPE